MPSPQRPRFRQPARFPPISTAADWREYPVPRGFLCLISLSARTQKSPILRWPLAILDDSGPIFRAFVCLCPRDCSAESALGLAVEWRPKVHKPTLRTQVGKPVIQQAGMSALLIARYSLLSSALRLRSVAVLRPLSAGPSPLASDLSSVHCPPSSDLRPPPSAFHQSAAALDGTEGILT